MYWLCPYGRVVNNRFGVQCETRMQAADQPTPRPILAQVNAHSILVAQDYLDVLSERS